MSTLFKGYRTRKGAVVEYSKDAGKSWHTLPLYLNEINHSPTGFEWGYYGSGPSQLAYAILRNLYDCHTAEEYHVSFKQGVIAAISHNEWVLPSSEVEDWFLINSRGNSLYVTQTPLTDKMVCVTIIEEE